ncbi:MAG: limonene-1,2-epoxide hydrolase family protein [Microthrixaceae bacterium]
MPIGLMPTPAPNGVTPTEPQAVVEAYLDSMAAGDVAAAVALLDENVRYTNVGLPTIHGRLEVARVLKALDRPNCNFEVYLHSIATNGEVVLNERTDVIEFGPIRSQFWVCGRFEVRDGLITVWRDYFDNFDIIRGVGRGLLGAVFPAVRPEPPESPTSLPGR